MSQWFGAFYLYLFNLIHLLSILSWLSLNSKLINPFCIRTFLILITFCFSNYWFCLFFRRVTCQSLIHCELIQDSVMLLKILIVFYDYTEFYPMRRYFTTKVKTNLLTIYSYLLPYFNPLLILIVNFFKLDKWK